MTEQIHVAISIKIKRIHKANRKLNKKKEWLRKKKSANITIQRQTADEAGVGERG